MTETGMGPTALLGGYLRQIGPDGAVKLARELCAQLEGDPDSFHGGVWPGNVDLDLEGKAVLGRADHTPAAQRPPDAVEYTAPEFFWHGDTSAAADVYAVGLMLYAGCCGGFLPFQPREGELTDRDRADALRRRMKGQAVTAPEGVSDELRKVIEKALAYGPEGRYITATEMLAALGRTDEALPTAAAAGIAAAAAAGAVTVSEAAEPAPKPAETAPEAEAAPEAAEPAPKPAKSVPETAGPAPEAAKSVPETAEPTPKPAGSAPKPAPRRTTRTAGTRQGHVRKDFESVPRSRRSSSAVPAAQRRRRSSKATPILAAVLTLAILGGAGGIYYTLHHSKPELSQPFTPAAVDTDELAPPTVTPGASESPEPSATARPTASPRPSASPMPSVSPQPTAAGALTGTGTSAAAGTGSTGTGTGTGSSGTGTGGYGTGTGSSGTGGTGGGTSTGSGSGWTGGNTGTGGGNTGGSTGGGTSGGGGGSNPGYTVQSAEGTVYLARDLVRVRSGPGTGYTIIGLTHKGDSLTRTGTVSNGWTQVTYNGVSGRYVYSEYLSDTPPTASPAPAASPEPSQTPSAPPAVPYTVSPEAKTYEDAVAAAGTAGLATFTTEEQFQALTDALADSGLEYVWIGAEKSAADSSWSSGGVKITAHWASGEPKAENSFLLLHKNGGQWQFITADSVDPAAAPYAGKLGYVTNAAS